MVLGEIEARIRVGSGYWWPYDVIHETSLLIGRNDLVHFTLKVIINHFL